MVPAQELEVITSVVSGVRSEGVTAVAPAKPYDKQIHLAVKIFT